MAAHPPWMSGRPRRAGAARHQQDLRAEARSIQRILRALDSPEVHRGCRQSRLGAALAEALRGVQGQNHNKGGGGARQPSKPCWHHAEGFCKMGSACAFRHDDSATVARAACKVLKVLRSSRQPRVTATRHGPDTNSMPRLLTSCHGARHPCLQNPTKSGVQHEVGSRLLSRLDIQKLAM